MSNIIIQGEVKLWASMYNKSLSDMHDEFGTVRFLDMCGLSEHKINPSDLNLRGGNIHKIRIGDPIAEYVETQGICLITFIEWNADEIYESCDVEEMMKPKEEPTPTGYELAEGKDHV